MTTTTTDNRESTTERSETSNLQAHYLGECYYPWPDYSLRLEDATTALECSLRHDRWLPTTLGCYYQFSEGLRVEPTTVTLRGGVKLQTVSQHSAPLPYSTMKAKTTGWPYVAQGPKREKEYVQQGPCTTTTTTMIINRGRMITRRRQEDHETTKTGVATTMVCHRMCDYHHYSPEEEERRTMVTTTGVQAQGEGCHYDTTTRDDCYGHHRAGLITGKVTNQETNDIVGLRHQTD